MRVPRGRQIKSVCTYDLQHGDQIVILVSALVEGMVEMVLVKEFFENFEK